MYTIKQTSDSFHTFYQVWSDGIIVSQADDFDSCLDYVNENSNQLDTIELPKATVNLANKLNIGLCLDLNTTVYGKESALELDYQGTLTVWLDSEEDHEGDAIYKLYKTVTGFKAVIWEVWTKGKAKAFQSVFECDNGLQATLRTIHNNK